MIKFVSKNAPNDRRVMRLDPTTVAAINILPGQVLKKNGSGFAVKADGAAIVGQPVWAFTSTSRLDTKAAGGITVVDGPFVAEINTEGYSGSPVLDGPLGIGTSGNIGKLVPLTVSDYLTLQAVVAYCARTADADGYIEMKVIR